MKAYKTGLLMTLVLLVVAPGAAQRARQPAKAPDTGAVTVTRSATFRVTIATDAVSLFQYLSDARKLETWLPDRAVLEPQLGGRYHFRWKDAEGVWSGVLTEFNRGSTLGFTWRPPGEREETHVRVMLLPRGAQTTAELTHSGFSSDAALDEAVKNWVLYLQNLKSVVEHGIDVRPQGRPGISRTPSRARKPPA